MTVEWVLPLALFALAMSMTPGPNTIMVTASAANFGFRRTLPHMLGITVGFPAMVLAIGLGAGAAFQVVPNLHQILKVVGIAYLCYLAFRVATAAGPTANDESGHGRKAGAPARRARPLNLVEAALFQWVNPKAWMVALGGLSAYTTVGGNTLTETLAVTLVFALVAFPSTAVWAAFGTAVGRLIASPKARRLFNLCMAALIVLSIIPTI